MLDLYNLANPEVSSAIWIEAPMDKTASFPYPQTVYRLFI
jgi:hypothetical protein